MESSTSSSSSTNPLLSFSTFIHQHCVRLGAELATRFEDTKRFAAAASWSPPPLSLALPPPFASLLHPKHAFAATLTSDHVAKSLAGTPVYTVSNSNNEFVLISDPDGTKSIGLLCFRQEDAEAFLAQVCSPLDSNELIEFRLSFSKCCYLRLALVFLAFQPHYFKDCFSVQLPLLHLGFEIGIMRSLISLI